MSARKKVNQSRPRALARAAASRVAGAVCLDAADDAKPPPTRRSSRPPSNSSANADSSMSPAPSGITASVLAESPVQSATPLYFLRHAVSGHARQRVAAVFTRESECAKAAILRSRCKFHRNRYHEAARFVTEESGVSRKFRPMELLPVHAIHPRFTSSSIIPDIPDEPIRSLEAAAKVVRRHAGDRLDRKTEELLRHIKGATTLEETGTAGKAFHLRSRIAAIALTWLRA